jgi:hypothetical protein
MDWNPPEHDWIEIRGERVMRIKDRYSMFGPRKDFSDKDIEVIKDLIKPNILTSLTKLKLASPFTPSKTIAIMEYLRSAGEIFEPFDDIFTIWYIGGL